MLYNKLVNLYLDLSKTTKRLEKTTILATFLKELKKEISSQLNNILSMNKYLQDDNIESSVLEIKDRVKDLIDFYENYYQDYKTYSRQGPNQRKNRDRVIGERK